MQASPSSSSHSSLPRVPRARTARLAALLLAAFFACWLIAELHTGNMPADVHATSPWRRTADGWEDRRTWVMPTRSWHPPLHPGVIASLQVGGLLTALALRRGSRAAAR